ncbi:protein Star isoform X2 [Folsomia candida]|uniref:protein Star isoform X2 n=1 Tax=Folsomia candida TaxID=158441 RepID=UPI0016054D59|nr:protein Star isoform X2 [Folsomia candida]
MFLDLKYDKACTSANHLLFNCNFRQNYIFKKSAADRSIGEQSETRPSKLVEYLLGQNLVTKDVSDSRYFVEIGANDGLRFTSAFYLETNLGWSGLIVEPYSVPFKELMTRPTHSQNRISFSNTTIAMTPYASKEKFHYNPTVPFWGGLSFRFYKGTQKHMNVVTIPLYTLLLAADSPSKIDLLILDTEGTELETLKTLPFDKVEVSLIAVETYNGKEGPSAVEEFLFGKGYESVAKIEVPLDPKLVEQISSIIVRTDVHSEYQIFKLKQN